MKQYIKLSLLLGVLAGTTACTDLDTDIKTEYTTYPDNPIAVNAKLEACYYYLRNEAGLGRNYWEGVMLQGDELMGVCFTTNSWFDNGRMVNPSIHNLKPDTPGVGVMSELKSGISYCNSVILEIGGTDGKDEIVAPVRTIRAFYHFLMMDLYGDVPLMDRTPEEGEIVERAPRADVARWIEQELLEVIPLLSEENNADTYGRPNKWMAKALLAKLYLNWAVYTHGDITKVTNDTPNEKLNELVAVCDEIIQSQIFEVGKGYRKKFFPNNGVHIKDFIYAMDFDPVKIPTRYVGGHQLDRFSTFNKANSTTTGPWGFVPAKGTGGVYILVPECVDRFNLPGDERNQMILQGPQYVMDYAKNYELTNTPVMYNGEQVNYTKEIKFENVSILDVGPNSISANIMKGCHLGKYPAIPEDYTDRAQFGGNDIPIFRYADILLSKAEAILRGATPTMGHTAASLINEVRDCASAPHIEGIPTLQELLDERSREFICEMWRRQDLIRFGQFENDWGAKHIANPGAKTELWRRVLPIPLGEMETNTNWEQNFGY